jgi:uncharacterized membrane protein
VSPVRDAVTASVSAQSISSLRDDTDSQSPAPTFSAGAQYDAARMPGWLTALTFLTALGCGVIGGVFYAFSTFVMRALLRRPAAEAVAAMQAINVAVINPLFLGPFLGTAAASAALMILALLRWPHPGSAWLVAGGVLYFVGTFLVTILFNVPLNNALEKRSADAPDAADHWAHYAARWTRWNHVRSAAAIAATAAFMLALSARG